jgi:Lrp/AsnC family transcriptional regulator
VDKKDRDILAELQIDAGQSIDELATKVALSRNACWRRVKQLERNGVIRARVALVDPDAIGLGLSVFVLIRTSAHEPGWLQQFDNAVRTLPEIVGAHRMSGDLDYVLRVRVADVRDYDRFYQRLIDLVPIADISASFVMDDIKETTALPV